MDVIKSVVSSFLKASQLFTAALFVCSLGSFEFTFAFSRQNSAVMVRFYSSSQLGYIKLNLRTHVYP